MSEPTVTPRDRAGTASILSPPESTPSKTSSAYRIAFILPWFGPWPNWMPLTWESCRWNPDIDWIVFTNQKRPEEAPENIKVYNYQLKDFYRELFDRLSIAPSTERLKAYKLCDFKGTWGAAFPDLLAGYDFWGICDLDLVWGNIRNFYPDDIMAKYDILTSARPCINGQCTLFRNTEMVNSLFRGIPDADEFFRRRKYEFMDENLLNDQALKAQKAGTLRVLRRRLMLAEERGDWDKWGEYEVLQEGGTLEGFPPMNGACYWEAGRVFHTETGTEMVLQHFHTAKIHYSVKAWSYPFWHDRMTRVEMNLRNLTFHFKGDSAAENKKYYYQNQFGFPLWNWIRHPIGNCLRVIKARYPRLIPALIPIAKKILGRK